MDVTWIGCELELVGLTGTMIGDPIFLISHLLKAERELPIMVLLGAEVGRRK